MRDSLRSLSLLVLEDDEDIREMLGASAGRLGYDIALFGKPACFLSRVSSTPDSIILLDLGLDGDDGVDVLRHLASAQCRSPIALMSGKDPRIVDTAAQLGRAYGLNMVCALPKPFRLEQLRTTLEQLRAAVGRSSDESASLHEALHRAIVQDELLLHFQPKLDLQSDRVTAVEALVRWNRPRKGLVPPGQFIPMAEETGLIVPLSHWVLDRAIRQIAEWRRDGLLEQVAVNIPCELLNDLAFPSTVEALLNRYGMPGSCLTLEITETGAMKDILTAMDVLARLRLKGISLSIDDFGTGYSSLIKLQRLPFSEIKIDRAFIKDADTNRESGAIMRAIIGLAKAFGMRVVAEGVEERSVLDLLVESGCDMAQGYYVTPPLPAAELARWLGGRGAPEPAHRAVA